MAKRFSVMDMMNEISREDATKTEGLERVSVHDIQSSPDNFYESSCIDQLKNSIYAMGGVRQNVLLVRNPGMSGSPYRVVAGHRRIRACMELVNEGHKEFEYVPAVVLDDVDRDTEQMLLVMTNSTQRELTDWEKVMQHMHLKEIIPKLKKRQGLDGRTRELEADYLGVSEAQVAIYNTIGTKLDAWLMAAFKGGDIGISLAYEAARLEPEEQKKLVRITTENGRFTEGDITRLVNSRIIKGQLTIAGAAENVSESDTSRVDTQIVKNVSESDTSRIDTQIVKNVSESDTSRIDTQIVKNVSESDTFNRHPAAGYEKRLKLRGGYESAMVDSEIRKYEGYLELLGNDGDPPRLVSQYNCLLDALDLLREQMAVERECGAYENDSI